MLAVNDLFYLASPPSQNLFAEDFAIFGLTTQPSGIRRRSKFSGESGYDHLFEFVIPDVGVATRADAANNQQPESSDRNQRWPSPARIRQSARPDDSRTYAILNDAQGGIPAPVVDALESYGVRPVAWSQREQIRDELAA